MSKITSPILLDSTGQEINETLKGIRNALEARTLIEDNITSPFKTWSSKKIVDALTVEEVVTGTNYVSFDSSAATPIQLETVIAKAPISIKVTLTDEENHIWGTEYYVPLNGTYHWDTGLFIMEDGTSTTLASHYLGAAQGLNTLEVSNVDSIKVTYKTISKQGGGTIDFDIISGGSAQEEA